MMAESSFLEPERDFDAVARLLLGRVSSMGSDPRERPRQAAADPLLQQPPASASAAQCKEEHSRGQDSVGVVPERQQASSTPPRGVPEEGDSQVQGPAQHWAPVGSMPHPPPTTPPAITITGTGVGSPSSKLTQEGARFARMGLGKGLDCTLVHPWASKTSYQAKEVWAQDLEITNEGQHLKNFLELAEDDVHMQASLESTLDSPSYHCDAGVAVDAHRTHGETHILRGRVVLSQRVGFHVAPPAPPGHAGGNPFQQQLERFIQRERTSPMEPGVHKSDPELCYDFIHLVGGMTHYVSSISLGAMEYNVRRLQGRVGGSQAGSTSVASVQRRIGSMRVARRSAGLVNEKIGCIREDSVQAGSSDEAVLRYCYKPLTGLVSAPALRSSLKQALLLYIHKRLRRKNGPYLIMVPEATAKGSHLYWQLRGGSAGLACTSDIAKATHFYIRPDFSMLGAAFFITTHARAEGRKLSTRQGEPMEQQAAATVTGVREERYIHVSGTSLVKWIPGRNQVRLEARASVERRSATFELLDRRDWQSRAVLETDWLPEEGEGQPFFLQPRLYSGLCLGVTGAREYSHAGTFCVRNKSRHKEGRCHMLFRLVPPPPSQEG